MVRILSKTDFLTTPFKIDRPIGRHQMGNSPDADKAMLFAMDLIFLS